MRRLNNTFVTNSSDYSGSNSSNSSGSSSGTFAMTPRASSPTAFGRSYTSPTALKLGTYNTGSAMTPSGAAASPSAMLTGTASDVSQASTTGSGGGAPVRRLSSTFAASASPGGAAKKNSNNSNPASPTNIAAIISSDTAAMTLSADSAGSPNAFGRSYTSPTAHRAATSNIFTNRIAITSGDGVAEAKEGSSDGSPQKLTPITASIRVSAAEQSRRAGRVPSVPAMNDGSGSRDGSRDEEDKWSKEMRQLQREDSRSSKGGWPELRHT
jgi:hypothetical protein